MRTLYERDFYGWAIEQSEALKKHQVEKLDFKNLLDEVEGLVRKEKRELANRLTILFIHLIKWKMQPDHRDRSSGSWLGTIRVQRKAIKGHLDENPSLKNALEEVTEKSYLYAREEAPLEALIVEEDIPLDMPFTLEEALDDNWMPE